MEADRVTAHAHETAHRAGGLAMLPHVFRDAEKLRALLGSYLDQVQEVEDALWAVRSATLEDATGDALDQIGELLVWPRGTLPDEDYRAVLTQVVRCNRSAGTAEELLAILDALMGLSGGTLEEYFPAAVLVTPGAVPALGTEILHRLLQRARSAGVKLHTIVIPSVALSTFRFASGELLESASSGFGDVAETTGGMLAGVLA